MNDPVLGDTVHSVSDKKLQLCFCDDDDDEHVAHEDHNNNNNNNNNDDDDYVMHLRADCRRRTTNSDATVAAPLVWNSLPLNVRTANSLPAFKNNLKTFLFRRDFNQCHRAPMITGLST